MSTREKFRARHPYPFLLWHTSTRAKHPLSGPSIDPLSFRTELEGPESGGIARVGEVTEAEPVLWPVRKAPHGPFPDRVSVGRASNCDIVVRNAWVSKLHAHFREITPSSAALTDARSANGITVDGVRFKAGSTALLSEYSAIQLGRVRLVLLSAGGAYDWLGQTR